MKKILAFFVILILFSCQKEQTSTLMTSNENAGTENPAKTEAVEEETVQINQERNTVRERFDAPDGYQWIESSPGSYGYFIEHFKLKPYGSKILKYNGTPIATQNLHEAVFDISVGNRDLQQCADAIIRLRAEYLKSAGKEDEIGFHYTSGDFLKWSNYKNGHRLIVSGNTVSPSIIAAADSSTNSFQNYLDNIFMYAGTISLNRETKPVTKNSDLKTGDILITPGSPGHVVFIAGVSKNSENDKLYLLGEGFTPAQSIHILSNPFDRKISPWYKLDVGSSETKTARYHFKPSNFRTF